ncbi:MAG: deoxyribodipyrimidine photo-lyase [Spirochaetaceae bacterium]
MSAYIDSRRLRRLNQQRETSGAYVAYWMQRSQRGRHNHALEYAIASANERRLPILVFFALTDEYPEAQERHYRFMVEGLSNVRGDLENRGIPFFVLPGHPPEVAAAVAREARLLVCDRAYLRHLRDWRRTVADAVACPVYEVETDVVVPVEQASRKREFAARTIRRKIMSQVNDFLVLPEEAAPRHRLGAEVRKRFAARALDLSDPAEACRTLRIDRTVPEVSRFFRGGTDEGVRLASDFLANRMHRYAKNRNQPKTDDTSHAGMYLHFGQISPLWLVLEARRRAAEYADSGAEGSTDAAGTAVGESIDSFVEELVVRRELAHNYVFFEGGYDGYDALPPWALTTLAEHAADERPHVYRREELEAADTHDDYWNAAMQEMLTTGYMHNYMRMYWGKKILEWSASPREGFDTALYLNNRYFLDGRDPNSYANVAWVFGLHDRPWQERPIFGKVRIMKASGLERKCDMPGYLEKVRRLTRAATEGSGTVARGGPGTTESDGGSLEQGDLFEK